jgi:thiol-disulfide isomerase/thioredoxin
MPYIESLTKISILLIITFFISVNDAQSQEDSRWINLFQDTSFISKDKISFAQQSYPIVDLSDVHEYGVFSDLSNLKISTISFDLEVARFNELKNNLIDSISFLEFGYNLGTYYRTDHKWQLCGLRGKIGNKEILIIDSNMNLDFSDDDVIYLPNLVFKPEWPKGINVIYPMDTCYLFNIEYEDLSNYFLYPRKTKIAVQVYSKLNSKTDSLEYTDFFKIGFVTRLKYEGIINNTKVSFEVKDALPWEKSSIKVMFKKLDTKSIPLILKDRFEINGNFYSIDSFDIVNSRLLLTNHYSEKIFFHIEGPSVNNKNVFISIDNITNQDKYKFVHVWGSWCLPCRKSLPEIVEFYNIYKSIKFYGLCTDMTNEKCKKVMLENKIEWDNIFLDLKIFEKKDPINVHSWPTYFILDKDNFIILKTSQLDVIRDFFEKTK